MHSQIVRLDRAAVADAMLARGMLRKELEQRSRLSHMTIWRACNGQVISLASAKPVARALGVSVGSLLAPPAHDRPNEDGGRRKRKKWTRAAMAKRSADRGQETKT